MFKLTLNILLYRGEKMGTIINDDELIHKAVRRKYDVVADSYLNAINQMKGQKVYAVGFNGYNFFGIKLTSNKQTNKFGGLKEWSAVMDSKTCDSCKKMNGQVVPIHEPFVFETEKKTYKIDGPPLHGFNFYGNKKITNAVEGTENDYISRFEEPTCRCISIYVEQPSQEDIHHENEIIFDFEIEKEEIKEDRFLLEVVEPAQKMWEKGIDLPDQVYEEILLHFEVKKRDFESLIKEMKRKGIVETLLKHVLI